MRILKILLLHCQFIVVYRLKSFIWFLPILVNCLLPIIFWQSAMTGKSQIGTWTFSSITTYYIFLTIVNSLVVSYVEGVVGDEDIHKGDLVRFLLRPFSYYWNRFISEVPYRLIQGVYGMMLLGIFFVLGGNFFQLNLTVIRLFSILVVFILAYFISYTYKLSLGFTAFWLKDSKGLHSALEIIAIVLGGVVMPLEFFPGLLQKLAFLTPYPYIVYFPVMIVLNKYSIDLLLKVISAQLFWLSFLLILNRFLWKKGLKIFTAAGR